MAARDDEKTHTEFVVEGHEPDEVEVEVIEDGKSFIFRNVLRFALSVVRAVKYLVRADETHQPATIFM